MFGCNRCCLPSVFMCETTRAGCCSRLPPQPPPTLLLLPPRKVEKTGLDCGVASPAVPAAMSAARLSTCGRQQQAVQPPLLLLLHGVSN